MADQLVLGGVDINIGEHGVRIGFPEASHGFFQPLVENLRGLVVGDRAADAVLGLGDVGTVNQRVRQAADGPCAVDPEVPSSEPVHTLQIDFPTSCSALVT